MSSVTSVHSFWDESAGQPPQDPTTLDGSVVVFDRMMSMQIRKASEPTNCGVQETLRVRIITLANEGSVSKLTCELSSESDLFFHFQAIFTPESFSDYKETQRLMVDFCDFAKVIADLVTDCIEDPDKNLAVLFLSDAGKARLQFIQNMGFKYMETVSMLFEASDEDTVRTQIQFRYNNLRRRCQSLDANLTALKTTIRVKFPAMYLQVQKELGSPSTGAPGSPVK